MDLLPEAIFDQHTIVLGKTRAGKSSVMRGFVEHLLDRDKPVCIVDPKGDWWGLKSSADGKHAGYPIVIFGGEHADVPLNSRSGSAVAELAVTGNRSCIIDLGGWMPGDRTQFWIDFSSTYFRQHRGRHYLVIDEVHNFCPKGKIMDPNAGKMLHWSNRLASEGLGKGISLIAASQRPQKVHNDFLTSCETLIAMRVIHAADRGAIKDWIDGCGDREKGPEVVDTLAEMKRGEAWAWSPEAEFGPKRIQFPMFKTYDSFKPQGSTAPAKLKGWADVDLADVTKNLEDAVKEADAKDPVKLQRQIAELKKELGNKVVPVVAAAIDTSVIRELQGKLREAEKLLSQRDAMYKKFHDKIVNTAKQLSQYTWDVPELPTLQLKPESEWPQPGKVFQQPNQIPAVRSNGTSSVGDSGLRRMLIALAQKSPLTAKQVGVRAGMSSSSGTFGTYLGKARSEGWITGDRNRLEITDVGLKSLGDYEPLPTGRGLLSYWLNELGNSGAGRMLKVLSEANSPMSADELGEFSNISSRSGTFGTYLGKLRTLELIEGPRSALRASEDLL